LSPTSPQSNPGQNESPFKTVFFPFLPTHRPRILNKKILNHNFSLPNFYEQVKNKSWRLDGRRCISFRFLFYFYWSDSSFDGLAFYTSITKISPADRFIRWITLFRADLIFDDALSDVFSVSLWQIL
jgi:hypothetical protein